MDKRLLLGDEAIALGALHSGLSGVYAYPGTPSTEITEFIQNATGYGRETYIICDHELKANGDIHSRWCSNEKTAMEAGLGMSYAGKRALVCMKHVGMNVCADPFVNSAITGVNGGLVILAADDPSMHSSQDEQDSRFYAKFAMIPVFEPSSQQEAYDMMADAYSLSESLRLPVMMRVVTRLAHSRANVEVKSEARAENQLNPDSGRHWVLLPAIARKNYLELIDKQNDMKATAASSRYNKLTTIGTPSGRLGVIACGIGFNYVMESEAEGIEVLKVSQYPLPEQQIKELASRVDKILIVEDGQPVVEELVHGMLGADYQIEGRLTGALPRTGELNPDSVALALNSLLGNTTATTDFPVANSPINVVGRPPALCQGCGHRDVYAAIRELIDEIPSARVFGDIGCYTLGALPPFQAITSCVDMGASITMAKGASDAGIWPAIAVIGDSTFTHSGMTGLLDAINDRANITVIISDNLTTGMTGGQDSQGTNRFEQICLGLGVEPEHLHVVVPLPKNMDEIRKVLRDEINYKGVSVIIPRRECIQTHARKLRQAKK
ncbi:MAG: indolepyruvate ferredoxin oxidoreductase [Prevotellaceae bacterium]|nr:indolepyruvate ferredoxin oxidoreductase [Candidatus Colivivens caballi]